MAKSITIYTTSSCPYCKMAKAFLLQKKVPFKEVNVEKDEQAAVALVEKTGQLGVPVIDIDGVMIIGFNKDALQHAIPS